MKSSVARARDLPIRPSGAVALKERAVATLTTGQNADPVKPTREARVDVNRPAFASLTIYNCVDSVRHAWNALIPQSLATPYQSPGFLSAWIDHVAPTEGVEPFIVVASDESGRAVALVPLCKRRKLGVTIAGFMGGSHVNFNAPVVRRDRVALFTAEESMRLLREAAQEGGVDVFVLRNQPLGWEGAPNPFAGLPRQPSPDAAYSGALAASLEEHLKTKLSAKTRSAQRRKMRRFEESGSPRLYRAETREERARILDVYFAQKAERFALRGIGNVFEKPGVREFIRATAGLDGAPAAIDLYAFDLDDRTLATFGTITDGRRLGGMFNSITNCELARYSPGELLLNFMVEDAIERGVRTFDLGVGSAPYKALHCPDVEPLFDTILGVSTAGRAAARAFAAKTATKAWVKSNPRAYGILEKARRFKASRRSGPTPQSTGKPEAE